MDKKEIVLEHLKRVLDPELGVNVVDLGLIYDIDFYAPKSVRIKMTLTTPGCPLHDSIASGVRYSLEGVEDIEVVDVDLVWEPAWTPEKMTDEGKRQLGFA
jgi:metal-sulfur cluster biosynthetic enzyme